MPVDRPSLRRSRGVVAVLAVLATIGFGAASGIGAGVVQSAGSPAAAAPTPTRAYGSEPIDDVLHWANQYASCGLTGNKLAAMMVVPTFTESGAATTPTEAPSPMTLSRWDTQSALWAFGNKSTPYQRAFWHPGVGMWQFDSAGGWNLSAGTMINSFTAAEQAAKVMSSRYCASTGTTDLAKIRYAWGPWYACAASAETTCIGIFNEIFDGTDIWVNRAYGVHRLGGAEEHSCVVAGVGVVTCYRIDPARAEGNRSFTSSSPSIPTPITAPFYSWVAAGREYRTWLSSDTGYGATVTASKPITANARTSLTWQLDGPGLCDATAGVGACSGWSAWTTLAPSSIAPPAVARNADGRLEVVYVGADGFVWHAWQTAPNGSWSAPARLGNNLGTIAAVELARDNQGFLYAFARDTNWGVWSIRQGTNDWGLWGVMGGGVGVLFDAATNTDGRLELFGLDAAGAVIHQFQWPWGAWSSWERLGGPGVYAGAAGVNPDGRMELFGVDRTGTLVHSWQVPGSGNGWSGWAAFTGTYVGAPSVVTRSDGLLQIFARGADTGLWDLSQSRTSWSGWTSPNRVGPEQLSGDPAGARNRDGRMEVFAGLIGKGAGNVWQTSANGAWSTWGALPGVSPVSVTTATNADGRLLLITRQTNGALLVSAQMS
jgi:hypothetical protein